MARLLGAMEGSHCPSCRGRPGPDCADKGRDTRHRKRIEQRAELRDWQAELAADYARSMLAPYDADDCRHGCAGGRCCGEPCTFICHEEVDLFA